MVRIDWVQLCEMAFLDDCDRLCMIGVMTRFPAPVLPIAHNAGYLWPKGMRGKRSGTITLSIGPSMSAEGRDAAQLTQAIESWIEGEVARLGTP